VGASVALVIDAHFWTGRYGDRPILGSDRLRSGYFDFTHIIVMKELVLAVVPFNAHAGPVAGTYGALIVSAVMPGNTLADLEAFGLGWSHFVHSQSTV
jgi:hypothetical protein